MSGCGRRRRLGSLSLLLVLAGCAETMPTYVAGVQSWTDVNATAGTAAALVGAELPPGSGSVSLAPPPAAQSGNRVTPALGAVLRARGYIVVDRDDGAHRVSYAIAPFLDGVLVRVQVDGAATAAAQDLVRDRRSGWLVPAAPALAEKAEKP